MNQQRGFIESKLLLTALAFIALVVVVFVVGQAPKTSEQIKQNHQAALTGLSVALKHANQQIKAHADKSNQASGIADIVMNNIPISILNGSMRATRDSIENGLDVIYDAKDTIHSTVAEWNMDVIQGGKEEPGQVKVFAAGAPESCYLLYTEAGTETQVAPATQIIIDTGC